MDFHEINLLDRDVFTRGIPHAWFAHLRNHAPVYRHPEPDGPGFWVITKYDDVVAVGRDSKTFSSAAARGGVVGLEEPPPEQRADQESAAAFVGRMMLYMDPPEHTRYRKLVNHGFTPRRITALEDRIRERTVRILDDAVAKGACDFVVDVAAELPLQAIAELLGVPMEDRHKIFEWTNRMVGSEDPEYAVDDALAAEAQTEMFLYANRLAADRRDRPRDDIVTTLINAEVDGHQLDELDFNLFFMLLSVAGNETTRNAISHGMAALLDHPEQYAELVEDPSLIPTATEEILRWASPVLYFRRNCTQDTEIRGQEIRAGDKVSIWYMSANRDEEVFDDPLRFDIHREPNDHVAFGGGGSHHCLGAHLARLEINVLFEELTTRSPTVESLGDLSRLRSNFIAGIKHLPVRFHPTRVSTSFLTANPPL